ncbi:uncharacterized protein THITE_2106391 [Thermothielavioides terrestris NRRL 8126]|uniref:Protein kinase domain-containing protein n=1 Tax=Thermothielavioides terrestris (strain ATCC 38088 / NRRL 8126) TaxID=578455 RepID=G2QXA7_THETT|nr:uncharacterized protein THITE_2106391 [Thermothielavioides terrestris NRRL 8126]AEO62328.1 hypothetical protein THITE_2106391 [Thermothielavioides terrestris NRRL 8126]
MSLTGLAELHDRGIMHTDIKPNNILIDYNEEPGKDPAISQVRISDLEDSVLLGPGEYIVGCLCGHEFWRSPESWARASQDTASDVYSFAVVAIYVMLDHMIFHLSAEELQGDKAWWHILQRHVSYFGDEDGILGLLEHLGKENPFFDRVIALVEDFDEEKRRTPFALWPHVDADFRDLICKMTSLDPKKRITAREALQHPWFQAGEHVG